MEDYMEKALDLAREALDAQEVPVGCVFIKDSKIIAKGRNRVNETKNPTKHAEINCIDQVVNFCNNSNIDIIDYIRDINVVVTVEPCIMCAAILHKLNIRSVVYGCANDRFGGSTVLNVSNLFVRPYEIVGNVKSEEAMQLLKEFYKGSNPLTQSLKNKKE